MSSPFDLSDFILPKLTLPDLSFPGERASNAPSSPLSDDLSDDLPYYMVDGTDLHVLLQNFRQPYHKLYNRFEDLLRWYDVNGTTKEGWTPLHVILNHLAYEDEKGSVVVNWVVVQRLLSAGANPDLRTVDNLKPIDVLKQYAARFPDISSEWAVTYEGHVRQFYSPRSL